MIVIAMIGCTPTPAAPTPAPTPVVVPAPVIAPPPAPPPTAVAVRVDRTDGWVDIVVNGTDAAARRVCEAIANHDIWRGMFRPLVCGTKPLRAPPHAHVLYVVDDFPMESALILVHQPRDAATGTITQYTWFDTREECERHKAEDERRAEDDVRQAREATVELLDKEVERADREARDACAAKRTDDCFVARETAKAFRERVAIERARPVYHADLGTCRVGEP